MSEKYAEVAVEVPLHRTFTYSIPRELTGQVALGRRVLVPFGKRTLTGFVISTTSSPPETVEKTRAVLDVLDASPLFDSRLLAFYRWVSSYYFAPMGEVLSLITPAGASVRSKRRLKLTPEGEKSLRGSTGTEAEILKAAARGSTVQAASRRLRPTPVHSAVARLVKQGLIEEEVLVEGGTGEKRRKWVRPVEPPPEIDPASLLSRAPAQAALYGRLTEAGEAALADLTEDHPGAPSAVKSLEEKGLVEVFEKAVRRDPFAGMATRPSDHEPNAEQSSAIDEITGALKSGGYSPFLLYGVTGSGKTLVYLRVLQEAVRLGKRVLFLAPEITLTPWPAAYLAEMFPGRVALAHSGLSTGERFDEWRRVVEGDASIVVGARSALFSPIPDLGLIVVDEEHDPSYKQDDGVKYNARDSALSLARNLGIPVVLGSATPSVETTWNSKNGKLRPLVMKKRVMERAMPDIKVVDMKQRKGLAVSDELKSLMEETLSEGHQAVLFLNRRGYSSFLICRDCGRTFECDNCSVTLTLHRGEGVLKCHYCDHSIKVPGACPECRGVNLITPGLGTEKVEEEVHALFPDVRTVRMDRDTTKRKGSARRIIESVENREVDVLVGTQMVSKGHHFPGVTLVGVVSGDTAMNIPDFRSAERTFQLITQAAGRAGRGEAPGRVIIQTLNPEHYCFSSAIGHDYDAFYDQEIEFREETLYPPFARLCCFRVDAPSDHGAERAAKRLGGLAHSLTEKTAGGSDVMVLGPVPAMLSRLKGRHRWNLLLKSEDVRTLHSFARALRVAFEADKHPKVNLSVDMDPSTVV